MTINPYRLIAATVSIVTVLIVQASLVSAIAAPLALSLPAVLVAVVGTQAGVSAGMSMGFAAGLLADLSSNHPAGVLALCWLAVGIVGGLLAEPRRRLRWTVLLVGAIAGFTGLVATALLTAVGAATTDWRTTAVLTLPTMLVEAGLGLLIIGPVRAVLRAHSAPNQVRAVRWARAPRLVYVPTSARSRRPGRAVSDA